VTTDLQIRRFLTRSGIRVYQLPVETFPQHVNITYLILDGDRSTLFDVGSARSPATRGYYEV